MINKAKDLATNFHQLVLNSTPEQLRRSAGWDKNLEKTLNPTTTGAVELFHTCPVWADLNQN